MATDRDKWARRQRHVAARYATMIDELYNEAAREAAALGVSLDAVLPADKRFSFDDYPRAKKRVDTMLKTLQRDMRTVVEGGIEASWQLSNQKNDELATNIFGKRLVSQLTDEQRRRYFTNNTDALEAFRKRKDNGLALSDRVWNYTNQFKTEIELALDVGLGQGKSADELSRDVRKYLKYPDKLFRRVRDKHGNLKLSKAAAAFHPGRGVYRSSYKNARRLTATECNMAYRAADYERWQTMDFVVGIRIVLSNNHEEDICDDLKGDYPKTFKFTGWHPHCRCHVETILKTTAEMQADATRIKEGGTPLAGSVNEVKNPPSQFTAWVQDNKERILAAEGRGSLPYFIRDNKAAIDNIFNPQPEQLSVLEKAELRHKARTQAEIDDIRRRAAKRRSQHKALRKKAADALTEAKLNGVDCTLLQRYIDEGNLDMMSAEAAVVRKQAKAAAARKQAKAAAARKQADAAAADKGTMPATLQQLEEAIKGYEYTDSALKRKEKEVVSMMKELLDNNDFGMEIDHKYLESVFEEGFLNTFQTGTSKASIDSHRTAGLIENDNTRLVISHKMFMPKGFGKFDYGRLGDQMTYDGKQLARREYEKYGYLLDRDKADAYRHNRAGYGDVQVRFKKDKVKTTWTFDDSLTDYGEYLQPSLTSNPRVESFDDRVMVSPEALIGASRTKLHKWQKEVRTDYIELQYHGDLTADCIESLTFPKHPLKLYNSSFVKKMADAGVELWYMESGKAVRYIP